MRLNLQLSFRFLFTWEANFNIRKDETESENKKKIFD